MPRETLRALDADVGRIMLSGGASAPSDEALHARRAALAKFSAKVPALAKVTEQIDKVLASPPRAAVGELMNLAVMSGQLRGAQAAPGRIAGDLAPLESIAPIETPLAPTDIEALLRALTWGGPGRAETIRDAVARGAVRDLRLLKAWVDALDDARVGDIVARDAIPMLGEAAVGLLFEALRLDGDASDGRRLECIAAIRGTGARSLIDEAITKGSAPLRAAGIRALARIDREATEPLAIDMLANDKNRGVRAAAAEALSKSASLASLEVLLGALKDAQEVRVAAANALGTHEHPEAGARLLSLLTPESLGIKPYKDSSSKHASAQSKAQQKAQEAAVRETDEQVEYVTLIMTALGPHDNDEIKKRLLEVWKNHEMLSVRLAAGRALLASPDPKVLETLAESLDDTSDWSVQRIAIEAFFKDSATLYERALPWFEPERIAKAGGVKAARVILWNVTNLGHAARDARWVDLFAKLLENPKLAEWAALGLLKAGDKSRVERILDLLPTFEEHEFGERVVQALEHVSDPSMLPALKKCHGALEKKLHKKKDPYAWGAGMLRGLEMLIARIEKTAAVT